MSGYHTHALIGAVGGLAACRILSPFVPEIQTVYPLHLGTHSIELSIEILAITALSSLCALWPDLDEPHSFPSRLAPFLAAIGGAFLVARLLPLLYAIPGAISGYGLGYFGVKILHIAAGGHRKLTHSVVTGIALAGVGLGCVFLGIPQGTLVSGFLIWGLFLHLLGDVVTPGGVELWYPILRQDIHCLPHWISQAGEPGVAFLAILVGSLLIFVK